MDPQLVALASTAAGTAMTLLVTDGWQQVTTGLGALWRRVHPPDRADAVEAELVQAREEILAAGAEQAPLVEEAVAAEWQGRLRRLLATHPELAVELRHLIDEQWTPALPSGARSWTGGVTMRGTASESGRVYQVGQGEQHITER